MVRPASPASNGVLGVVVPPELKQSLRELAAADNRTLSSMVRKILTEHMNMEYFRRVQLAEHYKL
jgi:predicted DNA-binding protein